MKRLLKAMAALTLSAAMCIGLCGCDTDFGTMLLVKKVYDSIEETESFEAKAEIGMELTYRKLSSDVSIKADCRCTVEPTVIELKCSTDTGMLSELEMPVYIVGGNKSLELYVGAPVLGETVWLHESLELPESADEETQNVLALLDKGSDLEIIRGEEKKIDGQTAVKLTLVLPGDMIAVSLGAIDETMEDLEITAWVNKKTGQVLRLEAELGELAQLALKSARLTGDAEKLVSEAEIEHMTVTIDVTGVNTIEKIELPSSTLSGEKAKNAA